MEQMVKERMKDNCAGMGERLVDLLLEPAAAPAKVRAHVEECDRCRRELDELRATMALLDVWKSPEPNPYFLTRLEARLREEREAEPAGWFARLRASFVYGPATHVRPLAAMALTIVLLVGGGAYLGVTNWDQPPAAPPQAAAVHDLQIMDSNAQLLDQLEALSSNNSEGN
jgi:cytochrome c-type biogenesis protein CcmH/NrfG